MLPLQMRLFFIQRQTNQLECILENVHPVTQLVGQIQKDSVSEEVANGLDDGRALVEEVDGDSDGDILSGEGCPEGHEDDSLPLDKDLCEGDESEAESEALEEVGEEGGVPPDGCVGSEVTEHVHQVFNVLSVMVQEVQLDRSTQGADHSAHLETRHRHWNEQRLGQWGGARDGGQLHPSSLLQKN